MKKECKYYNGGYCHKFGVSVKRKDCKYCQRYEEILQKGESVKDEQRR